jgi:hypothetical protein
MRLRGNAVVDALGGAWRRWLPWYPGDWIWSVLVLAALCGAATAAVLAARAARNASTPTLITTGSTLVSTRSATTAATTTRAAPSTRTRTAAPSPTVTTGQLPVAPGPPSTTVPTTPAPTAARSSGAVISWPGGRRGYTDVLESIPQSAGQAAATARAREALRAGLRSVGVLLSSRYSSLRAGYWVVFAGIYTTQAQAQTGLAQAHAHGFAGAYPARVAP